MSSTGADYASALADASALEATPRPTRRPTWRAMTRPPRRPSLSLDRVPYPGHRRRRLSRGHHEGDLRGLRGRPRAGLHHQIAGHLRRITSPLTMDQGSNGFRPASTPHWFPLRPVGIGQRRLQRGGRRAEAAGRLMFYGSGRRGNPTASAVMGDVVMAARNRVQGGRGPRESPLRRVADRADRHDPHSLLRQHDGS